MRSHKLTLLFLFAALLLQACGGGAGQAAVQTGIAQTLQVSELETAAANANTNPPQNTATTAAEVPPAEVTPTAPALVSVSQDTNCRRGPSASYGQVVIVNVGQQVEVLKTFAGDYVVVQRPDADGDCWLWLRYADKTDFSEYNLPTATQPPTPAPTSTPTPSFSWAGAWTIRVYHGGVERTGPMNCSVNGLNLSCTAITNPGAFSYNFTGTLSANWQSASGTFGGTGSGNWSAQILSGNLSKFIGNLDTGSWEFCGTRSGSFPSPCKWP